MFSRVFYGKENSEFNFSYSSFLRKKIKLLANYKRNDVVFTENLRINCERSFFSK